MPAAQLPELLESIAKSTKPMSEGEIRKTLSPGGVQIVADYDISRIATAMAGREFDPAKAEAAIKGTCRRMWQKCVGKYVLNMVIERANQVEKKFDETLLQDKTDAINRAIAGGDRWIKDCSLNPIYYLHRLAHCRSFSLEFNRRLLR